MVMQFIQPHFTDNYSTALVVNGAMHDFAFMAKLIHVYGYKIAVDGGLYHCSQMHLQPDLVIGDCDSIDPLFLNSYSHIPVKKFSTDKDETDTELALKEVPSTSKKIGIFGAMEKRTDHSLSNLHLLRRSPGKIFIETEYETIFSIEGKATISCQPGQTISLIPMGNTPKGIYTKGLKWELKDAILDKNFMSLSNICLADTFEISIEVGDVICCLARNSCNVNPNTLI